MPQGYIPRLNAISSLKLCIRINSLQLETEYESDATPSQAWALEGRNGVSLVLSAFFGNQVSICRNSCLVGSGSSSSTSSSSSSRRRLHNQT